jgi:hypothetical protein
MTEPKPPQNVDEVILLLQSERPILTKSKTGQAGNRETKYADLVQVNEVVLKRLNAMDTIWSCRPHLDTGVFGLHYSLKHVPSGTEITGIWPLKLSENPQQMGSATTYGRRYALLAVTGIVAEDEDDDGQAAASTRVVRRAPQPKQPTAERPATQRQSRPALPGETGPRDLARLHAAWTKLGWTRDQHLTWSAREVGHPVESSKDLTAAEMATLLERIKPVWEAHEKDTSA